MIRNVLTIIYMLLLSCALSSCEDSCKWTHYKSYHFIDCYEEWSSFDLRYIKMYNVFLIQFNAKQRYYSTEVQGLYNPEQTVENLNKFNELAAKNGDVGYDWEASYMIGSGHLCRTAIYPKITDILITSDCNYDESHPAETSLNDIFVAYYQSFTKFLGNIDHSDVYPNDGSLGGTRKLCNEIEENELYVISPLNFALYPKHPPTVCTGKHRITGTLTDENGEVHSATAERDFSQPE